MLHGAISFVSEGTCRDQGRAQPLESIGLWSDTTDAPSLEPHAPTDLRVDAASGWLVFCLLRRRVLVAPRRSPSFLFLIRFWISACAIFQCGASACSISTISDCFPVLAVRHRCYLSERTASRKFDTLRRWCEYLRWALLWTLTDRSLGPSPKRSFCSAAQTGPFWRFFLWAIGGSSENWACLGPYRDLASAISSVGYIF